MKKIFRTITNAIRPVRRVLSGIRSFAEMTAQAFSRRIAGHLKEAEELPPGVLALLQRVVARLIESSRDRLVEAERTLRNAQRAEEQVRTRRDRLAAGLYDRLLKARITFEAFGKGTSARYLGLDPGLGAVDSQVLVRYAHEAVDVLTDPDFSAPEIKDLSAATLEAKEHVKEIQPKLDEIEAVMDELEDLKRVSELALKHKDQAREAFREVYTYGSRFQEAFYVLAGEKFHAQRLRGKVGRTSSVEAAPLFEEDDAAAEPGGDATESTEAAAAPSEGETAPPPVDSTAPVESEATDQSG